MTGKKTTVEARLEKVRKFLHTVLDRPELLDAFPEQVYVPLDIDVASLFAPARLELLRQISRKPVTVGELAKAVHRKVPAVSRDLRVLEQRGLVHFRTEGKRKYPELLRHFVVLPLDAAGAPRPPLTRRLTAWSPNIPHSSPRISR
jgi:predicted transcriptional regulator